MTNKPSQYDHREQTERLQRFREACTLQAIEGNPLSAEQIAMFDMFRHEGWSDEKRRAYLAARARRRAFGAAAE